MLDNAATQTYAGFEPTQQLRATDRRARPNVAAPDPDDRLAPARGILLGAAAGSVFWVGLAFAGHAAWSWLIR